MDFKDYLLKITDVVIANRLPREQPLYLNKEMVESAEKWLKTILGDDTAVGTTTVKYNGSELNCDLLIYGGIRFYLILLDKTSYSHSFTTEKGLEDLGK